MNLASSFLIFFFFFFTIEPKDSRYDLIKSTRRSFYNLNVSYSYVLD
jgi:hypothetical protein